MGKVRDRKAEYAARIDYFREYTKTRRYRLDWINCKRCGFRARRLNKKACLECVARQQPKRDYTDVEEYLIEIHAGKYDPAYLQFRIYSETGNARTRKGIRQKIKEMGIRVLQHQDGYTITQLMELTGRSRGAFANLVRRGTVPNLGKGRRILFSTEDGERLINRYNQEPASTPSYTVQEVMTLLGYTEDGVRKALNRGLPSWKEGNTRRVCKATVDRAVRHLRDTGKIRINWRSLVK